MYWPPAPAMPVLAGPDVTAGRYDGVHAGEHPLPVVWMNPFLGHLGFRGPAARRIPEQDLRPFIPPDFVAGGVPFPNRFVGGARHQLEPLLALAQLFL